MEKTKKTVPNKVEAAAVEPPNHTERIKSQVLARIGRPPRLDRVEVSRHHNGKYRVNIWEQTEPNKDMAIMTSSRIRSSYYLKVSETGEIIDSKQTEDVLELRDGRIFEGRSRPQYLGDHIVGRVFSFDDVTDREQVGRALALLPQAHRLQGFSHASGQSFATGQACADGHSHTGLNGYLEIIPIRFIEEDGASGTTQQCLCPQCDGLQQRGQIMMRGNILGNIVQGCDFDGALLSLL